MFLYKGKNYDFPPEKHMHTHLRDALRFNLLNVFISLCSGAHLCLPVRILHAWKIMDGQLHSFWH